MNTTPAHTPTPWGLAKPFLTPAEEDDPLGVYEMSFRDELEARYNAIHGDVCASDTIDEEAALNALHDENRANAQFIVTACNAYDSNQRTIAELREALREMLSAHDAPLHICGQVRELCPIAKQARAVLERSNS